MNSNRDKDPEERPTEAQEEQKSENFSRAASSSEQIASPNGRMPENRAEDLAAIENRSGAVPANDPDISLGKENHTCKDGNAGTKAVADEEAADKENSTGKESSDGSSGRAEDKNSLPSVCGDAEEPPAREIPEPENKNEAEEKASEKSSLEAPSGILSFVYDTLELVAASLAMVMILLTLFARQSPVNGSSMYPTIKGRSESHTVTETAGKDVLLISNLLYTPKRGDIVVIQTPTIYSSAVSSMGHPIVKRIIAVGGDTMTIDFANWSIEINGEMFEEGYGKANYVNYVGEMIDGVPSVPMNGFTDITVFEETEGCTITSHGNRKFTLTVPEGMVFVMGDNRNNSMDSRAIGFVDERWIAGRSILRIYPFDRFGIVN